MSKFSIYFLSLTAFFVFFLGNGSSSFLSADDAAIHPYDLTVESMVNPLGIDCTVPRLAWKSKAMRAGYGYSQTAYQVLAASSRELLDADTGDLWDSGWRESADSIQIPYEGKPLSSDTRVYWKVRVKDQDGNASDWSTPAKWSTGILKKEDWQAKWIAQPASMRKPISLDGVSWIGDPDTKMKKAEFRREFDLNLTQADLESKKYSALLYYAGNTTFELYVNGKRVGFSMGMIFNPDLLRAIDVTEYLRPGRNTAAVKLETANEYLPAFLGELLVREIVPADDATPGRGVPGKTVLELKTDASWKALHEDIKGWTEPGFDDSALSNAVVLWEPDEGPWGKLRRFGEDQSPAFQKRFSIAEKKVKSASLFISGLGFYEASLDGKRIGKRLLDPAMTRYDRRVLYSVYDLTDQLNTPNREHSLDVLLGHGWYDVRSVATWNFDAAPWRGNPRLLAQLHIVYEDGTEETVATDESWDTVSSPVVFDCIRQGEIVDGGFEQKVLGKAELIEEPGGVLSASVFPGTMVVHEFPAASVIAGKREGTWIVDLGKNIAGWCRIKLHHLPKGKVLRFCYSERFKDGIIERHDIEQHFMEGSPAYYAGDKGRFQTDFYICGGNETEVFEPRFSYNGFQYIEVKGLDEKPSPEDFTACEASNGFPETGYFFTSNPLINAIQNAALSSYRANFIDGYPTDCPHREKNGWTGDAQLACEQAMYNWNNDAAYEKWIRDLRDEQRPDGNLAAIVPTGGWGYPWGNGPAWDTALFMIPWYLYVYKGNERILEESYESMKLYLGYMADHEDADHLVSHGLGDWCAFDGAPPVQVTSSSYYYLDVLIAARTAKLLGKTDEAEKYFALAERIRTDYTSRLINPETGVCSDASLAAQACAIHQGLTLALPKEEQQAVFDRLLDRMVKTDDHFDCGIFGVKYLPRTLSEGGRTDLALRLLLQETDPCMAKWIHRGAGTLWEDWGNGASRNHIMFGDVSAWFYQYLGGVRLQNAPYAAVGQEPGVMAFKEFIIAPECRLSDITVPGKEPLTKAELQFDSPYGIIISKWNRDLETGTLALEAYVPVNTRAAIYVPLDDGETVVPDTAIPQEIRDSAEPVTVHGKKALRYSAGNGFYRFEVKRGE